MLSGVVAEFDTPEAIERAFAALGREGFTRLTAWTPYPVRGVVGRFGRTAVPWIMLVAGLTGGSLGYFVEWWCNAVNFPIDVGARPLNSAPAFIPITFESAVLAASVVGFVSLLGACGLPRLASPMAEVEGFERASVDRFWIGVDAADPRFDDAVGDRLGRLGALRWQRVGEPA